MAALQLSAKNPPPQAKREGTHLSSPIRAAHTSGRTAGHAAGAQVEPAEPLLRSWHQLSPRRRMDGRTGARAAKTDATATARGRWRRAGERGQASEKAMDAASARGRVAPVADPTSGIGDRAAEARARSEA